MWAYVVRLNRQLEITDGGDVDLDVVSKISSVYLWGDWIYLVTVDVQLDGAGSRTPDKQLVVVSQIYCWSV